MSGRACVVHESCDLSPLMHAFQTMIHVTSESLVRWILIPQKMLDSGINKFFIDHSAVHFLVLLSVLSILGAYNLLTEKSIISIYWEHSQRLHIFSAVRNKTYCHNEYSLLHMVYVNKTFEFMDTYCKTSPRKFKCKKIR